MNEEEEKWFRILNEWERRITMTTSFEKLLRDQKEVLKAYGESNCEIPEVCQEKFEKVKDKFDWRYAYLRP